MIITVKRIYEKPEKDDGFRILVERLWPRGISRERAHIDLWLKDVAPSPELRKWFNHEDEKWEEFVRRYYLELTGNAGIERIKTLMKENNNITFVYSSRNVEHNNAVALKNIIYDIK